MPILPTLHGPADLRGLTEAQLEHLAAEIRETIIATVATTGGHLGSSLGVVELTIALHRLLESPRDRIVWDTGHQAYPHKLLTGRFERFGTLRSIGGVGGFPRRSESEHDVFDGGHAGTGLSIGQGLATARDLRHGLERIAVVVGDAAITSGLSLEALNDIGQRKTQLLIVLNDNEMSISPTVGGLSKYLSQIKLSGTWQTSKTAYDDFVGRIPVIGPTARELGQRLRHSVVNFAQAGRAVRGSRHHLHRAHSGSRHPRPALDVQPGARAEGTGHRPRPDPEGPRVHAGRDRPDRVPRGRVAADDRAAAEQRERRLGAGRAGRGEFDDDADRVDGGRCRSADRHPRSEEASELHGGLRL